MPILVECSFCGKKYTMREEHAGAVLPCKECGTKMKVPGGRRREKAAPARRAKQKSRRRQSTGGTGLWIAIGAGCGVLLLLLAVGLYLVFSGSGDAEPVADEGAQLADAGNAAVEAPGGTASGSTPPRPQPAPRRPAINPPKAAANPPAGNPVAQPEPLPGLRPVDPEEFPQPEPARKVPGFGGLQPAEEDLMPNVKAPADWRVEVDPANNPLVVDPDRKITVKIPNSRGSSDVLFPAVPSRYVAVGTNNSDRETREVWSLDPKKKIGTIRGDKIGGRPEALSADGRHFAVKPTFSKGLLLIDVRKGTALGTIALGDRGTFLGYLQFAGSDRLLARGNQTPLMVWSIPSGEPEREIELPERAELKQSAFSPGGRYLALPVVHENEIVVIDLTTGDTAGAAAIPEYQEFGFLSCSGLAFSPDGQEFAGLFEKGGKAKLLIWEVDTGRLKEEINFAGSLREIAPSSFGYEGDPLEWFPNRQRWLLFGEAIADRDVRKIIWRIPGEDQRTQRRVLADARIMGATGSRGNRSLITVELPEDKIAKSAEVIESGGTMADAGLPKLTKADHSREILINLEDAAGPWKVQADPAPAPPGEGLLAQSIQLQSTSGRLRTLMLSRADAACAAVMYSATGNRRPRRGRTSVTTNAKPVWVDVYNLIERNRVATLEVPFVCDLLALSPDGKQALMRLGGSQDRLDLWNVEDGSHALGWRPFMEDPFAENESKLKAFRNSKITAAVFVDNSHVLTMSDRQRITLWEFPACRAVYSITGADKPGLSPNGKYLVISNGKTFKFIEAITGNPAGELQSEGRLGAAGFHPDGERFAVTFSDALGHRLICWNLPDGRIINEFPIPKTGQILQWTGESHLLLDGVHLIDVDHKMFTWKYQLTNGTHSPFSPDDRHWFVASKPGSSSVYLAAAQLPDARATDVLAARELKPEFLLQPGDKISLQVNIGNIAGKNNVQQEAIDNLVQKFSAAGITAAPNQPVVLHLGMSHQRTGKTQEYNVIGGFGSGNRLGNSFSISEEVVQCPVTIQRDGRTIWERNNAISNVSFMVTVPEGKSPQQVATEGMWNSAYHYLTNFDPPAYVFPEGAENGLGTSSLVPN